MSPSAAASQTFTWNVNPLVTLTSPGTQTNAEGDTVDLSLSATDSADNALEYTATNLPQGLTLNYVTGVISGTIWSGASLSGPYSVTVTATDSVDSDSSASQTFTWNVNPVVTLANPGAPTNADGDTAYVPLSANDSAGNALTYSATGLPTGLTVSSSTGIISGTVSGGDDAYSPYSVTVTATDSVDTEVSASQSFYWTVTATGTITVSLTQPSNQTNSEGDPVDLALSASDSASNALVYAAVNLPAGLSINPSTGAISGTVYDFDSQYGPYTVTVSATDSTNPSVGAYQTFTWNVNPLVTLTAPAPETNADGDTVYLPLAATDSANNALTYSATGLPAGLSINSAGAIVGTVSAGDDTDSPYSVTVTATDSADSSGAASQSLTWTVNVSGTITVSLTAPSTQTNLEEDSVSLSLAATDSASNSLVYSAYNLPPGLTVNSTTGEISGTIVGYDSVYGPYTVIVSATDCTNPSVGAYQTFTWNVNPLVTLAAPSAETNADGDTIYLPLSATDSAGNAVTYSATSLPSGLSINSTTGLISGTISAGANADSPYTVTVTATDSVDSSSSASQTITWTINATGTISVTLAQPADQTNLEEDSVSLSLSATDSASNSLTYSASNLPAGLTLNSTTGVISGTIFATDSAMSPYVVTVSATDSVNASVGVSRTFEWNVSPLVTLTNPGSITDADSDTVFVGLSASDSDSTIGASLIYSATNLPSGLTINPATGMITGTVSAGADTDSPYAVTVTATDFLQPGSSASESFTWTITSTSTITVSLALPANQTNAESDSPSLDLAATDSAENSLVYGAFDLPPGLTIDAATGVISGTISAGDSANSPYTIIVTATDSTNSSIGASQTFEWTVNPPVQLENPGNQAATDGATLDLPIFASSATGDAMTYSASGLPAGLSINTYTGIISGTISASNGSYSVTVTATDVATSVSATATFDWIVNPVVLGNPGYQHNLAGDTVDLVISGTDQYSYSLTYSASNLPDGLSINSATGAITGTIALDAVSDTAYTVTITATDGTYSAMETFEWRVNDVTLQNPGSQINKDGQSVNLTIIARAAYDDTVTYSATGLPTGLSINSSTGAITGTIANNATGPFNVTITATDGSHSASASRSFVWNVSPVANFAQQPQQQRSSGLAFAPGFPRVRIVRNLPVVQVRGGFQVPAGFTITRAVCTIDIGDDEHRSANLVTALIGRAGGFDGGVNFFSNPPRGTPITVTVTVRIRNQRGESLTATIVETIPAP